MRLSPQRARVRHIVLALLVVFLFLSFRATKFPAPGTLRKSSAIQAAFLPETSTAKTVRLQRQGQVKDAFRHAWNGYKEHAWLHDEVSPISGGNKDTFVGWAATLVDALDTLYIMGLHDEFEVALKTLEKINFSKPNAGRVPVFETTIRYLGGLLGAWDISGHKYPILLEKATQLGEFLYKAFDTENGIPVPYYSWKSHGSKKLAGEKGVIISQIGSLSLEFIRLSQVTGDNKYAAAIQIITDQLEKTQNTTALPGMWPTHVDSTGPLLSFVASNAFTLGALADSLFEYLPKTHLLLSGSSDHQYLDMYHTALASFSEHLFFQPSLPGNPDILFSGYMSTHGPTPELYPEVQHLGCFTGGMVALGSRINKSPEELEIGRKLTDGCVWAYENTPSGIMPEIFRVKKCDSTSCTWTGEGNGFSRIDDSSYQLRPEAIESVFIMYRLTGDKSWQEKGWKMFQAITKHTRTDIANARLQNVMDAKPIQTDSMESFWLAETLKYFYLLYSEPGLVSLDDFVLNTEAHPLRWGAHGAS